MPRRSYAQIALDDSQQEKDCGGCGKRQPFTFYHLNRKTVDGLSSTCKDCAVRRATEWAGANRGKYLAYRQRPEQLERRREYDRNVRDREAKSRSDRRRRHARGVNGREDREYDRILRSGDPCCYCGGPAEHVDHIEPLAHSGDGRWTNLTAACADCNFSKNDRPLLTFLLTNPLS